MADSVIRFRSLLHALTPAVEKWPASPCSGRAGQLCAAESLIWLCARSRGSPDARGQVSDMANSHTAPMTISRQNPEHR
jgi:hypothetical protein